MNIIHTHWNWSTVWNSKSVSIYVCESFFLAAKFNEHFSETMNKFSIRFVCVAMKNNTYSHLQLELIINVSHRQNTRKKRRLSAMDFFFFCCRFILLYSSSWTFFSYKKKRRTKSGTIKLTASKNKAKSGENWFTKYKYINKNTNKERERERETELRVCSL